MQDCELFRQFTSTVVQILNDLELDQCLFSPKKPHSWMLKHQHDEKFMYAIKKTVANGSNLKSIDFSNLTTLIKQISYQDYLRFTSSMNDAATCIDKPLEIRQTNLSLTDMIVTIPDEVKVIKGDYDGIHQNNDQYGLTMLIQDKTVKALRQQLVVTDCDISASEKILQKGTQFDILVYAPPHSGKSTFINRTKELEILETKIALPFQDTDDIVTWSTTPSWLTVTNMPHLIMRSKFSIAVVPSKEVFENRCLLRGCQIQDDWYSGMLKQVADADVVIYSNDYLLQIFQREQLAGVIKIVQ